MLFFNPGYGCAKNCRQLEAEDYQAGICHSDDILTPKQNEWVQAGYRKDSTFLRGHEERVKPRRREKRGHRRL